MKRSIKWLINRLTRWVCQMEKAERICWAIGLIIAIILSVFMFIYTNEYMHWLLALLISIVTCFFSTGLATMFGIVVCGAIEVLRESISQKKN